GFRKCVSLFASSRRYFRRWLHASGSDMNSKLLIGHEFRDREVNLSKRLRFMGKFAIEFVAHSVDVHEGLSLTKHSDSFMNKAKFFIRDRIIHFPEDVITHLDVVDTVFTTSC